MVSGNCVRKVPYQVEFLVAEWEKSPVLPPDRGSEIMAPKRIKRIIRFIVIGKVFPFQSNNDIAQNNQGK